MSSPAILFVYSDPGTKLSEEEYHDWYDNEHIPLRVEIPAFTSWSRWKASDGAKPGWAALYDLTNHEELDKPPYVTLAETRSERETEVFKRIGLLDRRTYEQLESPIPPPSALFDAKKPARYVVAVEMEMQPGKDELLTRWYDEEHSGMLAKLPGWVRSRRFVLKDWGRTGLDADASAPPPLKFLALHEWEDLSGVMDPAEQAKWQTPLRAEMDAGVARRARRVLEFQRTWARTDAE